MAIDPVKGYGQITQSNAKEIYTAYRKGEVNLTAAQRNYAENFLSDEDLDDIDYEVRDIDSEAGKKNKSVKDDAKNAESHDGQGANAAATSVGVGSGASAVFVAAMGSASLLGKLKSAAEASCIVALVGGTMTAAAAIVTRLFVEAFDNGYDDRVSAEGNSSETNDTLDTNAASLEETMESMNEDMELYQAQSEEYSLAVNGNISDISSLEMQLSDAMAAGDKEGAKRLQEQIAQLKKNDFSGEQEGLDEIRNQLNEYQYGNEMAQGVSQAGNTVAEFLKEGTPLGAVAVADTAIIAAAGICASVAIKESFLAAGKAALKPFIGWGYAAAGFAGAALFAVAAKEIGASGYVMGDKAKHEIECGSAGRDMQGHVEDLNEMIEQQSGYMETTTEAFTEADDASAESQDKAQEAAAKLQQDKAERKQSKNNKPVVAEQSKPAATGSSQQNA